MCLVSPKVRRANMFCLLCACWRDANLQQKVERRFAQAWKPLKSFSTGARRSPRFPSQLLMEISHSPSYYWPVKCSIYQNLTPQLHSISMRAFSYAWSLPITWRRRRSRHSIRHSQKTYAARKLHVLQNRKLLPIRVLDCGNRDFGPILLLWPWPWTNDLHIRIELTRISWR